jgi:myo-inositol-1-phosphate synthase
LSNSHNNEIRVAIIGVGNCANSLIQGVTYYKDAAADTKIPGLMHPVVGGYHISDIKFVAAFDVDAKKVGLDLVDAMWASENNTIKFSDVAKTGVIVQRGHTLDGLGDY